MNILQNRFTRRTTLREDEYRTNFRQIDRDAIELLKSSEARQVTHLMAALYLTLIDAPHEYWEREGVLRFTGDEREGKPCTAWRQLVALLGCGNSTAKNALDWMHAQGLIGYYAGKNGAGIRIFINRAVASIGKRRNQKNLRLVNTPNQKSHTPTSGIPFNDSYAVLEALEINSFPHAPKNGAETNNRGATTLPIEAHTHISSAVNQSERIGTVFETPKLISTTELVSCMARELEPSIRAVVTQTAAREHERTREWFETKGLPKAARVAQYEAYNVLRKYGLLSELAQNHAKRVETGQRSCTPQEFRPLSNDEVAEMAQVCLAMLETKEQSIEFTSSKMSAEAGGFLLPEDALKVREAARTLLLAKDSTQGTQGGAGASLNPAKM